MTFDKWFNEIENFSTRNERFFEELGQRPYDNLEQADKRIIAWLQAAYEVGYKAGYDLKVYEMMDDLK